MTDEVVEITAAPSVEEGQGVEVTVKPKTETKSKTAAGVATAPEKTTEAPIEGAEGIDELKAQVEKARRESAQRLAEKDRIIREAFERAQKAELKTAEVERDSVSTELERLKMEKETAKRDYLAAHESGDAQKMIDAQDRLSAANAKIVEAEKGKLALEEEAKVKAAKPVPQGAVDDFATQLEKSGAPRSAAWLRSHPQYVPPGELNDAMVKAHFFALSEGHPAETDGYFEIINQRLGLDGAERQLTENRQKAPVAAPVTRQTTSTRSGVRQMPGTIRLTPEEVAAADAMGMDRATYAKNLWELAQEGKISRAF